MVPVITLWCDILCLPIQLCACALVEKEALEFEGGKFP